MNTESKHYEVNMLSLFISEFINIVELLKSKKNDGISYKLDKNKKNIIIVQKDIMIKILEHHGYITCQEKLELYRDLGFIECETNRFTKRHTENKHTVHIIYIREVAYLAAKKLISNKI